MLSPTVINTQDSCLCLRAYLPADFERVTARLTLRQLARRTLVLRADQYSGAPRAIMS
jgi:hypothetical protein